MMLNNITPLILTYNEAPNIDRTLQQLTWAKRIVVIDSYSEDETLNILARYPQVELFQHQFSTFATQCNYGLEQVKTDWVLSLDADYYIRDELIKEMEQLTTTPEIVGYFARFKYCVFGKPLRTTILPSRQVLFKKDKAIYLDDGHAHLLQVQGASGALSGYIEHDDRKPFSRWLWAQDRYATLEVKKLTETPWNELSLSDRIRRQKFLAPFVVFFYCLLVKGGILDGKAGWYYAFQRMLAELILSIRLLES